MAFVFYWPIAPRHHCLLGSVILTELRFPDRILLTPLRSTWIRIIGLMSDANARVGDTLRIAMDMIESGAAFCVLGNHEANVEYWCAAAT